ncbi:AAA family ATPase [Wenxinia marina]|uniref:AAA domain protein n=1 Tax=Wenxinia marina DSM 24838 TaxID=1123501 RepID=A0A0D0NKJ2_9RHOB|nr:AAA family ATPase [Wenxinia marina]KIQ68840.1 AAA domain protein [Wenxinia marina DSM 24838]GGL64809.1 hypothetical protein GCM10011392_19320 [Wenxinia marina]
MRRPLLIVLSGLPGSGKTTLAHGLATRFGAVHLRIDTIEQALRTSPYAPVEVIDHGYRAAMGLARDNLAFGHVVIGDAVNGMAELDRGWAAAAEGLAAMVAMRIVCSDEIVHRKRVETAAPTCPATSCPPGPKSAPAPFAPTLQRWFSTPPGAPPTDRWRTP